MSKDSEKAAAKVKATQNTLYKLQLERSQSVIIIRNLAPITSNRETYEDLEKCVWKMLKDLHVNRDGIRINSVRRLQRSKMDKSGDHLRKRDPSIKTRVGIDRGDIWPSILMKKRGTGKYEPVLEQAYERAKDEVTRKRKREAEKGGKTGKTDC